MLQNKFLIIINDLRKANKPFAIATVIKVKGSASARQGDKAVERDFKAILVVVVLRIG